MKKVVVSLFVFLYNIILFSQEKYLANLNDTKILSKKVVSLFEESKTNEALDELLPYWVLPINEFESLKTKTEKYMNLLDQRIGKSIGFIKIKEEKIVDIAFRETYIVRHQYHGLRLIFTYYKSDGGWVLNGFKWDDSFTEEFE